MGLVIVCGIVFRLIDLAITERQMHDSCQVFSGMTCKFRQPNRQW